MIQWNENVAGNETQRGTQGSRRLKWKRKRLEKCSMWPASARNAEKAGNHSVQLRKQQTHQVHHVLPGDVTTGWRNHLLMQQPFTHSRDPLYRTTYSTWIHVCTGVLWQVVEFNSYFYDARKRRKLKPLHERRRWFFQMFWKFQPAGVSIFMAL